MSLTYFLPFKISASHFKIQNMFLRTKEKKQKHKHCLQPWQYRFSVAKKKKEKNIRKTTKCCRVSSIQDIKNNEKPKCYEQTQK